MLKKEQYIPLVRREYPPFYATLILEGYHQPKYFNGLLKKKYCMNNLIKHDHNWYYSNPETKIGMQMTFQDWQDKRLLNHVDKEFIKREKRLLEATKKSIKYFCQAYESYMPALCLVFLPDALVSEKLTESFSSKIGLKKTKQLMNDLNYPIRKNIHILEKLDLLKTKNLESHVRKYDFLYSRYGQEKKYTIVEAKKHLADLKKNNFSVNYSKRIKKLKKDLSYARKILDKKDKPLLDLMQFIVYYRTHRTDVMNKASYLLIPKLKERARENGLTYNQILHCSKREVLGKLPSVNIINERMLGCAEVLIDGKVDCISGKKLIRLNNFFTVDIKRQKKLPGNIASPGMKQGIIKVVMGARDYKKINKGDILVTSMTTPNMIAIMKKAAAFVTDEGGITCHAAIIAREMKKPCIIGTKVATKLLKDGDMVIVDANKGVVKKK